MINANRRFQRFSLWRDMTAGSWRVAFLSCLGAIVYGYDVSWWSSVLGMPEFRKRFGIYDAKTEKYTISAQLQSAGSAIPYAGLGLGSVLATQISDRFGRRDGIMVMSIGYIIAVIIEVTSNSYWQVVIGRFCNGIPQGLAATMLPIYQSECAPASCRGGLISIYTWFVDIGAVTATGIVYNTWSRKDSGSYKIVMGIQIIYPLLILVTLPFLPETPRYLCMKGREDEALQVLTSLRKDSEQATLELEDIKVSLNIHVDESSWVDLFKGSNLRRTIIALVIPTVETWQGLSFIGNYLVVFLISLGTTNTYQLVVLINSVLLMTLTFFFWAPDFFGRRTLLLFGSACMWAFMFIVASAGGLDVSTVSEGRQQVAVGMLFLWAIVYSSTWANLTWVTLAEIPTTRLKTKTAGLGYFLQICSTIIVTLVVPYLQSDAYVNWGAYIGFLFGSFSFIGFWFVFFFYPETKGATIEELDLFFEQRLSVSQFSKVRHGKHIVEHGDEPESAELETRSSDGMQKRTEVISQI